MNQRQKNLLNVVETMPTYIDTDDTENETENEIESTDEELLMTDYISPKRDHEFAPAEQVIILRSRIPLSDKPKDIPHPFANYSLLSFMQSDKYIFEFAYLLQKTYGDQFKEDWCRLRNECNEPLRRRHNVQLKDPEEEWNYIDLSFITGNLNFDIHNNFVMKVIAPLFNEMIIQRENVDTYIKNILSTTFVMKHIKNYLENKLYINPDLSSYSYNSKTKLYTFNSTEESSILVLKNYLLLFDRTVHRSLKFFNDDKNKKIINILLNNISASHTLKEILIKLSEETNINFNKMVSGEIAYKDNILDFKTGLKKERNNSDYYTDSIKTTFLTKYNKTPKIIKTIFGNDELKLKEIQTLIGSLFTNIDLDYFILFTDGDEYFYDNFFIILEEIFVSFMTTLCYGTKLKHQIKNIQGKKINLNNKNEQRVYGIKNINIKKASEDILFKNLFSKKGVNIIGSTTQNISKEFISSISKSVVEIKCEEIKNNPVLLRDIDIYNIMSNEKDFIFTWIMKGAQNFLQKIDVSKFVVETKQKNKKIYESDDSFSSSEDEDNISCVNKTHISNLIISFIKDNVYRSIGKTIPKKLLFQAFMHETSSSINEKEFNKHVKEMLQDNNNDQDVWINVDNLFAPNKPKLNRSNIKINKGILKN